MLNHTNQRIDDVVEVEFRVYDENKTILPPASSDSPNGSWFSRIWNEFNAASETFVNLPVGPAPLIGGWMDKDERLMDVRTLLQFMPIGWSGTEDDAELKNREEVDKLNRNNILDVIGSWSPILLACGVSEVELEHWVSKQTFWICASSRISSSIIPSP